MTSLDSLTPTTPDHLEVTGRSPWTVKVLVAITALLVLVTSYGAIYFSFYFENPDPGPGSWVFVSVFLAINVLTPKFVGHQVSLNALTVTIAMMFWGWLWGAAGLILAVPLTAAFKAVCDNVDSLKAWGAWMGEG